MELYYEIILWNRIEELYHEIILGVPGVPWDLLGPLGTPLGHPGDAHGIPGDTRGTPWTTRTAIYLQSYSARRSRLLHPNPFIATHEPKYPPGLFYDVFVC